MTNDLKKDPNKQLNEGECPTKTWIRKSATGVRNSARTLRFWEKKVIRNVGHENLNQSNKNSGKFCQYTRASGRKNFRY
jgi:hypothetical protein